MQRDPDNVPLGFLEEDEIEENNFEVKNLKEAIKASMQ